ncbi:MAG: TMEM175 family protein [Ferruginibacter sp.]
MSQKHQLAEERKQFQLERMILFSDAVFAIAITLLVIEIKVPEFEHGVTQQMLLHAMAEKWPDFVGFIISFAVIGQFWTNHHKLFGYVKDYNGGLMWLNLLMLLWIALMPFSTYLNMKYGHLDFTWFWYCTNLTLIGLSVYLLWRYIGKHKHLCTVADDKLFMQFSYQRALVIALVFFSGALLTLLPWLAVKWSARFVFFLIFPAMRILRKRYEKQQHKKAAVH